MSGRRIFPAALVAAVAIIGVLWGMEQRSNRRWRDEADSSRRLLARLNLLEVDNFRLSNLVVRANAPLADAQLAELEKLREEAQELRHQTNDLQMLQTEVRRLRAELSGAANSMTSNAPPDVPAGDIYPKDSWKFAGYDTPEDTLESVTWAISQGDEDSYLAGLSPDLQDEMQAELEGGDFTDVGPGELSNATGFRIVDRESMSDTEVIYTLYIDGQGDEVDMVLEYIDGVWVVIGSQ